MKKMTTVASLILFLTALGVSMPYALAQADRQGNQEAKMTVEGQESALMDTQETALVSDNSEYQLPYPGILPDHPLYFLKRLRDNILETLISDPLRKAEFYVLQADKRLQMGLMLKSRKQGALSESTISKGEKYLEKAITYLNAQKQKGSVVPAHVLERIERSLQKHQEILMDLVAQADEAEKVGLSSSLDMAKRLLDEVPRLKQE